MIDVIHTYSRADAISDGVLRDVSSAAAQFKIRYPVAITEAAWFTYVEFDREALEGQGQSVSGRLADILRMFVAAARASDESNITFSVLMAMPDRGDWKSNEALPPRGSGLTRETHRLVTLRAVCGPGDDPRPVITIMMPDED